MYDTNRVMEEAIRNLLWIVPPEAMCRLVKSASHRHLIKEEFGLSAEDIYFTEQKHG